MRSCSTADSWHCDRYWAHSSWQRGRPVHVGGVPAVNCAAACKLIFNPARPRDRLGLKRHKSRQVGPTFLTSRTGAIRSADWLRAREKWSGGGVWSASALAKLQYWNSRDRWASPVESRLGRSLIHDFDSRFKLSRSGAGYFVALTTSSVVTLAQSKPCTSLTFLPRNSLLQ